jgi:hypothetical protein
MHGYLNDTEPRGVRASVELPPKALLKDAGTPSQDLLDRVLANHEKRARRILQPDGEAPLIDDAKGARDDATKEAVVTGLAIADDHVVVAECVDESHQVSGVALAVAVGERHERRGGRANTVEDTAGVSLPGGLGQKVDREVLGQPRYHLASAIRGTVFGDHQAKVNASDVVCYSIELTEYVGDGCLFVVGG